MHLERPGVDSRGAGVFQRLAADPAAEHRSGRDTGASGREHIPDGVAKEDRLGRVGLNTLKRGGDDVRMGFCALGVGGEVTAQTRSSASSALRNTASSSSPADVASTARQPRSVTASSNSRAPGRGRTSGAESRK